MSSYRNHCRGYDNHLHGGKNFPRGEEEVSRYRSYGKLDDPFTSEGDTFFLRMNARLRPNQLKPGEVALSKNGRMNKDGTWQTRKGLIDSVWIDYLG